ncbi:MAG: CBS domain-containing protein [Woeseiaceae bacterium]|jgi:predicted transcriptional regulator
MKLERLAVMTKVMRKGMTLRDFFEEAARCNVPGLPYVDDQGQIIGRISMRDIYKRIAVPDNVISLADAMGDKTDRLDLSEKHVLNAFTRPVEDYVLKSIPNVSPESSLFKALVIMEAYNTHYIFLIDEGEYKGVVTRMVIANRMLDCLKDLERARGGVPPT